MFNKLIKNFYSFDLIAQKIMKFGLSICFFICTCSLPILLTYNFFFHAPFLFYLGLTIFKLVLVFSIEFIICGYSTDFIKKTL